MQINHSNGLNERDSTDEQAVDQGDDNLNISQTQVNTNKKCGRVCIRVKKFFQPLWRKLALMVLLTMLVLGGIVLIGKKNEQYSGTSKTSQAATGTYDVIVYDSTSSGMGAIVGLAETAKNKKIKISVLWLKQNGTIAMPQNGLGVEDFFGWDTASNDSIESGSYKKFRKYIANYYNQPNMAYDREKFTNTAAQSAFSSLIGSLPISPYGITLSDKTGIPKKFDAATNTITTYTNDTYTAKYFIDTSIEADLARVMGASYRLGMNETIFNDVSGTKAATTNVINCASGTAYDGSTKCTPTPFTSLLTLKSATTTPTKNTNFQTTYASTATNSNGTKLYPSADATYFNNQFVKGYGGNPCDIGHMYTTSFTEKGSTVKLYEFNQHWNDYRIPNAIVDWYMQPNLRSTIRQDITGVAKAAVTYLNTKCVSYYNGSVVIPGIKGFTIASTPTNPYIRGEMRIVGKEELMTVLRTTGSGQELLMRGFTNSVAIGNYMPYDRRAGDSQINTSSPSGVNQGSSVEIKYSAMLPKTTTANLAGLKNLIVSTAISTRAIDYNSPIRMENTRMMMGEAAGTAVALAKAKSKDLSGTNYLSSVDIRAELSQKGVSLTW